MSDDEVRRRLAESFSTDDRYEPTEQDYAEADKLLAARDEQIYRQAGDWIAQHDPADELGWFIDELRAGLREHPVGSCKQCYTPGQVAPEAEPS